MRKRKLLIIVFSLFLLILTQSIQAQSWQPTKRLTWNSGASYDPAIATDSSGNIHVVWTNVTSGNSEIYYKRSTDGGSTWQPTKRLTWNAGDSRFPAITTDSSGNIHVVWADYTSGNFEIYYKRSTDGGSTWQPHYEIYHNYEIYYKRSTDGGSTWQSTKRLTWNSLESFDPAIAIDSSGNIHVVWCDYSFHNFEICYKRSTDGGSTWQSTRRLTWNSGNSVEPAIAIDSSSNIHVVWVDDTPGNSEIYYKRSTDGGSTWTTKRLTWNAGNSWDLAITTDSSGNIHVVWADYTSGNFEIYYKRSTDGGSTWQPFDPWQLRDLLQEGKIKQEATPCS